MTSLTKTLLLGKGKAVKISIHSRHAFATYPYPERGLLTTKGKTTKNKQEILDLL